MMQIDEQVTVLQLQDVSTFQEQEHLLTHVNFSLFEGEVHAVVGMTQQELDRFIDLLGGKAASYTGKILFHGEQVESVQEKELIDIVQSGINCFTQLTAVENIFLTQTARLRLNRFQERRQCQDLLDRFQLRLDLSQKVKHMTRTECKLIEMLRAYIKKCPVVLLCEPFLDIDQNNRASLLKLIQEMRQRGQSIILTTCHLDDALHLSNRISVIDHGQCKITAKTDEVLRDPKEVMYMLSGWAPLRKDAQGQEWNILQTIVNARDILSSTSELRKELLYLAKDITKVLHATSTSIYLINESANGMIEAVQDDERGAAGINLPSDMVWRLVQLGKISVITPHTNGYEVLFGEDESVQTMFCMPVDRGEQICGLIQTSFDGNRDLSETDMLHLKTFGREIAIAIETSNLIGRSMLLQESHHRIKNNLQMITSMIYMQKLRYHEQGGDVDSIFEGIISQISSIAIVHNLLAKDEHAGSIINLRSIIVEVAHLYDREDIRIELDVEDISIPYNKATQIALVVNELLCNCVKHAFTGRVGNRICVSASNNGKDIWLIVADNGCGISHEKRAGATNSIGISVVRSIISSLRGSMEIEGENGTTVSMHFPTSHVYDARNSGY